MDTKNLKHVNTDTDFDFTLRNTVDDPRLAVFEFYTTWCPFCRDMAPYMRQFADLYPNTLFVKVNAEKCKITSAQYNLQGYPTFVLYKNKNLIDRFEGKDPAKLEREVIHFGTQASLSDQEPSSSNRAPTPDHHQIFNISTYLDKKNCRCFNDLSVSSFQGFLDGRKLTSGNGVGKLLMIYAFQQPMMLHHFRIKASRHAAPKSLKFYADQPMTLDFDDIATLKPARDITLFESDINGDSNLDLSALNVKPVSVLHVLVAETASHRRTELDSLNFFGYPLERPHNNRAKLGSN